jgi:hypothetical protein
MGTKLVGHIYIAFYQQVNSPGILSAFAFFLPAESMASTHQVGQA